MIQRFWPWLAAILSGLLLTLSFPPFGAGGLAFVALGPLLCAVWLKKPVRRAWWFRLRLGFLTGLFFFTTTFAWVGELAPLFEVSWLNVLPLLLGIYLAVYPAVWAWFAGWIVGRHFENIAPPEPGKSFDRPPLLLSTRNLALSALIAAAWTALEWMRGWLSGLGWNALGAALHDELVLIQIAEFTGVGGVSFLLVLCNAIGVITILRVRAEIGRVRMRPHFDFTLTVALVVVVFGYGVWALKQEPPKDAVALRVVSIQPNIPQKLKLRSHEAEVAEDIRNTLASHHLVAVLAKPHLTLWPEASIPGGMLGSEENYAFVRQQAEQVPALLLGTDDLNRDAPGDDHNSAAFLLAGRKEIEFYDKRHLVPFGEFTPFRPIFGWFADDFVGDGFLPGKGPVVFHLPDPGVKLGPLICFEDTDAELAREPVLLGADVLINITNDGWFGRSCETRQHFNNSIFRAIENRRPLIRSTNSGTTASVDAYGRVSVWVAPFTATTTAVDERNKPREITVAKNQPHTFFTRHGELFSLGCAIASAMAILVRAFTQRRGAGASKAPSF